MSETPFVNKLEAAILAVNHFFRVQEDHIQSKHGISSLEMDILQLVSRQGPMKMKDISQHYSLKLSTLTSVVDKAEKTGILMRRPSMDDRRVVLVEPSDSGRVIFRDYLAHIQRSLSRFVGELPSQQREQLFRGFEIFLSSYSAER